MAGMISVIVPIHDSARALRRCLRGVAVSGYSTYDCSIVSDGFTDGLT